MKKKVLWCGGALAIAVIALILVCHIMVVCNASGRTFDIVDAVPHNRVGMLLATSPVTPGGAHNFYFDNRIKSAVELYKAGKVDFIIASGGDYRQSHNMAAMSLRQYLIPWLRAVFRLTELSSIMRVHALSIPSPRQKRSTVLTALP